MRWMLLAAIAIVLVGCDAYPQYRAKQEVRESLKDPDSAKFSEVSTAGNGLVACGLVNAKNGFGGYIGNTPFMVWKDSVIIGDATNALAVVQCCSVVEKAVQSHTASDKAPNFEVCRGIVEPFAASR